MTSARLSPQTTIRFDVVSDEDRALFVSHVVAGLLAVAWLTLVHMMPGSVLPKLAEPPIIFFDPAPESPIAPPRESGAVRTGEAVRAGRSASGGAGSIRDLFKGSAGPVDAGTLFHGVDVSAGGATAPEPTARKVGLGTGVGSRTPGMTRSDGLRGDVGVGSVRGEGVSRQAVVIAAPEVRAAVAGGPRGDASAVGQIARAHTPQLERCYHQEGLTRNPSLAGLVRLAIDVEAGRVTSASILNRSWVGAGAAETEDCLVRAVRGWRLGSSDAHIVLPLSFTSPPTRASASPH